MSEVFTPTNPSALDTFVKSNKIDVAQMDKVFFVQYMLKVSRNQLPVATITNYYDNAVSIATNRG